MKEFLFSVSFRLMFSFPFKYSQSNVPVNFKSVALLSGAKKLKQKPAAISLAELTSLPHLGADSHVVVTVSHI